MTRSRSARTQSFKPNRTVKAQRSGRRLAGVFHFGYDTQSREALTGLIVRQPDLRKKLSALLVEPSYQVARLDCDRGDQTYVLLSDQQLVAIYRDGDIGAIDRLARL